MFCHASLGGDEWKLVADKVGHSGDEIRFFDKPKCNPAEEVLSWLGERPSSTVGNLYDILVDCDMPTSADLM